MKFQFFTCFFLIALTIIVSCSSPKKINSRTQSSITTYNINVTMDLSSIVDDKFKVNIDPDVFTTDDVYYIIPKIVPGTYRYANYADFIERFTAYDYNGSVLKCSKVKGNIWKIENGKKLDKISYWVNDTFEDEKGEEILPMSGTSFIENKVFLLNLYALIGYFKTKKEKSYSLEITSPKHLTPYTSLTNRFSSTTLDKFSANRYFEVADSPILYTSTNAISFEVEGTTINFAIYSPSNTHKVTEYKKDISKIFQSIKAYLKNIKTTDTYNILLYLANNEEAKTFMGTGALEHQTSTSIVYRDFLHKEDLLYNLTNTISHEFFHTITPLNLHSEEIHYFDFNDAKMSQHLWMYEGVVEYFSILFQVNQGLINEKSFISELSSKFGNSLDYDDGMPFTTMSANILQEPYADNYGNVYEKGALIAMCLDILIREKSGGSNSLLMVIDKLSQKYGKNKPFVDDKLIEEIIALTDPEIKLFFDNHVIGFTEINYNDYLSKVGLEISEKEIEVHSPILITTKYGGSNTFYFDQTKYYTRQGIFVVGLNSFLKNVGLKINDEIIEINGKNPDEALIDSEKWKSDNEITFKIKRNEKELELKGKVGIPTGKSILIHVKEKPSKKELELRNYWLKK